MNYTQLRIEFNWSAQKHTECDICYAPMSGLDKRHRHCCSGSCAAVAYD